jgi:hypothetical protein
MQSNMSSIGEKKGKESGFKIISTIIMHVVYAWPDGCDFTIRANNYCVCGTWMITHLIINPVIRHVVYAWPDGCDFTVRANNYCACGTWMITHIIINLVLIRHVVYAWPHDCDFTVHANNYYACGTREQLSRI